jgi:uncharacterized protein YidB (DUF937 family)
MGLLDGIIGGIVGAEMATTVNGLIARHGGLGGIVKEFQSQGFGPTVKSWISTGENLPISSDQLQKVLGADNLAKLAAKTGMTPDELAAKLTVALPQVIDKLTPNGTLPPNAPAVS